MVLALGTITKGKRLGTIILSVRHKSQSKGWYSDAHRELAPSCFGVLSSRLCQLLKMAVTTIPCHFPGKHRKKWQGMKYDNSVQRQKSVKIKPKNHWENRWNIRLKELPLYLVELIEVLQSMEYRNILYLTKS